ncbi:hypothetical protein EKD00_08250 [Chlorobium phaeovibrioides]|uniref:Uncharacterized protein n=2 Tax=Chlorobium phaeovibrioides TaxID=1094 RepID=A0A3S0N9E4_CHLPH|nr:hypothetical protein [Chlorobium phaeovibrioides]HCD36509.1 hypothetical protein [Chlorobium sp.]KAA6231842.1 hypothetical protein FP507_01035 [Chlorobium phaeovibrioides]MWV53453.1 hypothetical protein [Chlorobium phaeovibrioides]QEQ57600.1 hypothetical protein FNV82_08725 [Chlorobium phaeovibrioides]RTY34455.1 hypothetical protein EKD00_08250 [Chlorobium phaeovibrioides]
MIQTLLQEKYPVYTIQFDKKETSCGSVDDIIAHFKKRIDAHSVVRFIGVFDHYAHTASLEGGVIAPGIKAAKNILFCFGKEMPSPLVLAVRPRSIGVTEMDDSFVVTFLEAPNPTANEAMESWTKALIDIGG